MSKHLQNKWRIGEYAIGGVIEVTILEKVIRIACRDFNSNAIVNTESFDLFDKDGIGDYLHKVTSSYYACQIIDWITSCKVTDKTENHA